MNKSGRIVVFVIVVIILVGVVAYFGLHSSSPTSTTTGSSPIATASYMCSDNKTITAQYFDGTSKPSTDPNQPPTPGGSVQLSLSDGRTMTLAQTISADGARYANSDESFVFWNKGNGATVTEGSAPSYTCISVVKDPGNLPQTYENGTQGFSIRLGDGFTTTANYTYQNLGPGKTIGGVKFTIPASMATGTNLSNDSYISVEEIPNAQSCSATLFLPSGATASAVTDQGTDYSFASSSDAAAGNRYEEDVYALPGTNPCVAVRYFIHWGAIENYPTGAVKEFDKAALTQTFDSIRRTLTLDQQ